MADYRELWGRLGMDLEKHDVLCEVLPQLYGGVYLSQENRPEGMNYYNFVVSEGSKSWTITKSRAAR